MERQNQKTVILTVGIVIMLIGGCGGQEQNISQQDMSKSDMIKRERLITAENKRLTREIEKQREQLAKRLPEENAIEENKKLRQTIEKLNAQVERLEGEVKELKGTKKYKKLKEVMTMEETIRDLSVNALKDFEEITKLREENGNLQTEIAELKKELETHREPTPPPHTD
jgi:predicted  nucleic acid-binding Zn-ribbon protein